MHKESDVKYMYYYIYLVVTHLARLDPVYVVHCANLQFLSYA